MNLETQRLILRPWRTEDAPSLYRYASDARVGPCAGWPPHTSVENSRQIIETILSAPGTYAIVLKETNEPVGSAGLMIGEASRLTRSSQEAEIGYWIGVPYWGQGLVPEAVAALIRHAKEDLHLSTLWCGYFDGNEKSRRVQEKCGFVYDHSRTGMTCQIEGMRLTEHISKMSLENSGAAISEN